MKTEVWENIQRGRRAVKLTAEIAEKDHLERGVKRKRCHRGNKQMMDRQTQLTWRKNNGL